MTPRKTKLPKFQEKKCKNKSYFYYVETERKIVNGKVVYKRNWIALGSDLIKARAAYAELEFKQVPSKKGTFNELADIYERDQMPKLAASTQESRRVFIGKLRAVFGAVAVEDIKPHDVAFYLDNHPKLVSANREIAVLSKILSIAVRWGWIAANPCLEVSKRKEESRAYYMTDNELFSLLDHAEQTDPQLHCMIGIAYLTGLRVSDILNLRLKRPDREIAEASANKKAFAYGYLSDKGIFVETQKTKMKQFFEFTEQLEFFVSKLKEIRFSVDSAEPFLILNKKNKRWSKTGFDSRWKRFKQKIGLDHLHFHDLRSKAATDAAEQNKDYQNLLGHTDKKMSEKYIKRRSFSKVEPMNLPRKKGN